MASAQDVLAAARSRGNLTYRLDPPPDGVTTTDCSLLVVDSARDAGVPLPRGVRTAEQIRQATVPVGWDEVKPGDLLFFEQTYDAAGPAGPDGKIASHVGFSLGAGTLLMLDAHERAGADVAETSIGSGYWQDKLIEARRLPGLVAPDTNETGDLTSEPDHLFSFEELWPTIKAAGDEFGFDPHVLAGIIKQESGFRNWRVHFDGTGHGLLGLDDNGMLPGFERWSGMSIGRGQSAASIPIVPQIRYAAYALADYANRLGGPYSAARAWHRGEGGMNDSLGRQYEQLIRAHVASLFANGEPPIPETPTAPPVVPDAPQFSVGRGIRDAMMARGDTPATSEHFTKIGDSDEWSEAYGVSGRRYLWLPRVGRVFIYEPAA